MSYTDKLIQIDRHKEEIESFGELTVEVKKKINYKFRLDWNYYSNSMEGNTLSLKETRSVMVGNLSVHGKPIKDLLEMKGHDEVITEILKIGRGEQRLSEMRIKKIHKAIMHEDSPGQKKEIGRWKLTPNHMINYKGEKFNFAAPSEVPELIHALLNKTNAAIDRIFMNKKGAPHPVDVALQFHLEYLTIHPFLDGNGRTARILTNLLLISFGYPPFWIKTDERDAYDQYLGDIQGYGGKEDLLFEFMADLIIRSQKLTLDAIKGKEISDEADLDKEIALIKAQLQEEDQLTTKSSVEEINQVMEKNIFPLLEMLEQKAEELSEFFLETDRKIAYNCRGDSDGMVDSDKPTWEDIKQNWFAPQIKKANKKLTFFRYSYGLKGFKKATEGKSIYMEVSITFNDYDYEIHMGSSNRHHLHFPYGRWWDKADMQSMVVPLIKEVIVQLKQLNNKI